MTWRAGALATALLTLFVGAVDATAQNQSPVVGADGLVQLDFNEAELTTIIDVISKMTNKNFIYDERVRGKVTIKSPTRISKEQAYAVFESVLQVKGFTTVETPGGALKVIPLRDAKQSSIETTLTYEAPPNTDRYVTRLVPLRYIEAKSIVSTLKPLISKDASLEAYEPTNMVIMTESASNIRRILAILEAIDIESYQEELAVFKIEHADAATLASQLSEIYGGEVTSTKSSSRASSSARSRRQTQTPTAAGSPKSAASALRGKVRMITDERTNSLIVLALRAQLDEVRGLIQRLDVRATAGGRIHVYYLQHADAEELAQTLSSLVSGRPSAPTAAGGAAQAQAMRSAVSGLAGGIAITADPATNALVIQASREGYDTIVGVIEKLDVDRPQVLVEALIMEVDITDSEELGFTGLVRFINGDTEWSTVIAPTTISGAALGGPIGAAVAGGAPLIQRFLNDTTNDGQNNGRVIDTIIRAAAGDNGTNILSAPHILTMDNETAEIRIGQNIPIISSRVQSAAGISTASNLATSVNIERQDIGVNLRVTPQITEGDSLRLEIFQEITAIAVGLTASQALGDPAQVGVPLTSRQIENTVVVKDGETVVIGGLLSDDYQDQESKIPFLGDIPILGWAFKSTDRTLRKINLLVFLTPHIIRSPEDLEFETIRKREEFAKASEEGLEWSDRERAVARKQQKAAEEAGEPYEPRGDNPVRIAVLGHEEAYPPERLLEIKAAQAALRAQKEAERRAAEIAPRYAVQAPFGGTEGEAIDKLQAIIDAGYDGTLVSSELGNSMYFELQIGPYPTLGEAKQVSIDMRGAHSLDPSVVIVLPDPPEEP
jgi:general secretion pathway protein D